MTVKFWITLRRRLSEVDLFHCQEQKLDVFKIQNKQVCREETYLKVYLINAGLYILSGATTAAFTSMIDFCGPGYIFHLQIHLQDVNVYTKSERQ